MPRCVLALFVLGLSASAQAPKEPPPRAFTYVHVWALQVVVTPGGVNTPNYVMAHFVEGPLGRAQAVERRREIATIGLETGDLYFPAHRVQLVELRGGR
jgi:hypothetical protein